VNFSGLGHKMPESWLVCIWIIQLSCSAFQCLLICMILITTAMVMAIRRQCSCGVLADSRESQLSIGLSFDMVPDSGEIYEF
jgi:hypothetical protein